jgi:hypothetical protein
MPNKVPTQTEVAQFIVNNRSQIDHRPVTAISLLAILANDHKKAYVYSCNGVIEKSNGRQTYLEDIRSYREQAR